MRDARILYINLTDGDISVKVLDKTTYLNINIARLGRG